MRRHVAPSGLKCHWPQRSAKHCQLPRRTIQYPLGESNPCLRTENPMSWATRRRGRGTAMVCPGGHGLPGGGSISGFRRCKTRLYQITIGRQAGRIERLDEAAAESLITSDHTTGRPRCLPTSGNGGIRLHCRSGEIGSRGRHLPPVCRIAGLPGRSARDRGGCSHRRHPG